MDNLCSIDEAAARLEVHRNTISRWIARGDLDSVKIGRRRKVVIASIEEMITPPRVAARLCTPEEADEIYQQLNDLLAQLRAERRAGARR